MNLIRHLKQVFYIILLFNTNKIDLPRIIILQKQYIKFMSSYIFKVLTQKICSLNIQLQ